MQKRYHIRAGARTTAGGTVRASLSWYKLNGMPLALEGDPVDCPACGTTGAIRCVGPRLPDRMQGRQCALDGDLCDCQCHPPPTLIAEQSLQCQVVPDTREPANEPAADSSNPTFDERPRLLARPIAGLPYHIQTADGRKFSGRAGPDGLLPRIATEGAGEYTVYWGDEALHRAEGSIA